MSVRNNGNSEEHAAVKMQHRILSKKVITGVNDFFTVCPEAEKMWDFEKNTHLDPHKLLPGSALWADFKCPRGHEFRRHIYTFSKSPSCQICRLMDNNVTKTHPDLMKWWDYEKNKDIDPQMHYKTSKEKVWWKCPKCGYGWQAEIASRVTSKGQCPCCETKIVVIPGINDMFSLVPEAREDYDFEKNKGIDASNIMISSQTSLWWKCHVCSYSWKSSPSSTIQLNKDGTYQMIGCSVCRGTKRGIPFYEEYPKLAEKYAADLNDEHISDLKMSSNKLYWWRCPICNEPFKSLISAMIRSYSTYAEGCPYCAKKKVVREKSFGYLHPEVLDEYDPLNKLDPFQVTERSSKMVSWICRENPEHRWNAAFGSRAIGYGSCPVCKIYNYSKMLWQERPDLESYFDTEKNERMFKSYSYYSNESVYWKCKRGHSFKRIIANIIHSDRIQCPTCRRKCLDVLIGENDLLSQYPDLASEFDSIKNGLNPDEIKISSKDCGTWWTCSEGHSFQASISYRIRTKVCPICSDKMLQKGYNTFADRCPELAREWSPNNVIEPDEVLYSRHFNIKWICPDCSGEYTWPMHKRILGDKVCSICNRNKLVPEINSFAAVMPEELVNEWSPNNADSPWDILSDSAQHRLWKCRRCHGEYLAPVKMRRLDDNRCPFCTNRKALPGFNSIADIKPELVYEWSPSNSLSSSEVLPNSPYIALWKCNICHGEYHYSVNLKEIGNKNCPYCNNRKALPGFNSIKVKQKDLIREWDYQNNYLIVDPDHVLPNSTEDIWWKCSECGTKYKMSPQKRLYYQKRKMKSCTFCKGRRRKKYYHF